MKPGMRFFCTKARGEVAPCPRLCAGCEDFAAAVALRIVLGLLVIIVLAAAAGAVLGFGRMWQALGLL